MDREFFDNSEFLAARAVWWTLFGAAFLIMAESEPAVAADPAAAARDAQSTLLDDNSLEALVAPVALYPDELLAIVLPASTYPLQIVQAARFLDARKSDASLQPDADWDDSIIALLNYPEVVDLLNTDLDWTWRLGEAVLNQQAELVQAVSRFRERAMVAGNLQSDEYKNVQRKDQAIAISSTKPDVVYVPYYEPTQVIYTQAQPVYYYYPEPYPVYYYPYPATHRFPSHAFWGLTSAFTIGWISHGVYVHDHGYRSHPYYHHSYQGHGYRGHHADGHHQQDPGHHDGNYRGDDWRAGRGAGDRPGMVNHDSHIDTPRTAGAQPPPAATNTPRANNGALGNGTGNRPGMVNHDPHSDTPRASNGALGNGAGPQPGWGAVDSFNRGAAQNGHHNGENRGVNGSNHGTNSAPMANGSQAMPPDRRNANQMRGGGTDVATAAPGGAVTQPAVAPVPRAGNGALGYGAGPRPGWGAGISFNRSAEPNSVSPAAGHGRAAAAPAPDTRPAAAAAARSPQSIERSSVDRGSVATEPAARQRGSVAAAPPAARQRSSSFGQSSSRASSGAITSNAPRPGWGATYNRGAMQSQGAVNAFNGGARRSQ